MNHQIVADGYARFLRGRQAAALAALEKKYGAELAKATPAQAALLRARMQTESHWLSKHTGHRPSPGTLW